MSIDALARCPAMAVEATEFRGEPVSDLNDSLQVLPQECSHTILQTNVLDAVSRILHNGQGRFPSYAQKGLVQHDALFRWH